MSVYLGFTDQADMEREFGAKVPEGAEVIVAVYGNEEAYSGYAFVLFRHEGKLYEVHGSHCSCYGLAGDGADDSQWEPSETTPEALRARPNLTNNREFSREQQDAVRVALAGL